jgi:peptide/bleomycin uptake transporter
MFHSFFPKPKLFFLSFAVYALAMVVAWYVAGDRLQFLSLGPLFGVESAQQLEPGIAPDVDIPTGQTAAPEGTGESWADPQTFWFYQYMLTAIALFVGFWMWYAPHPWQLWSVAGSALIFFTNWFLVQLDVMINEWFGTSTTSSSRRCPSRARLTGATIIWASQRSCRSRLSMCSWR